VTSSHGVIDLVLSSESKRMFRRAAGWYPQKANDEPRREPESRICTAFGVQSPILTSAPNAGSGAGRLRAETGRHGLIHHTSWLVVAIALPDTDNSTPSQPCFSIRHVVVDGDERPRLAVTHLDDRAPHESSGFGLPTTEPSCRSATRRVPYRRMRVQRRRDETRRVVTISWCSAASP
jgi:hypothetical protein